MKTKIEDNQSRKAAVGFILLALFLTMTVVPLVHADQFDQQIQALNNQNATNQSQVSQLRVQAVSYQDQINLLQGQINSLQNSIYANEAQQAQLEADIQADQAQIDHEKVVLGASIKAQYVTGGESTIEMLASSHDLNAYIDRQAYSQAVDNKIQDALISIANLENQQKAQKDQVIALLGSQRTQEGQLSATQSQQAQLLAYNQSQQDQYNQQIQANQAQISKLRQEQIAANTANVLKKLASGTCGGGYPNSLCGVAQDSVVDPWHMLNRECVSYTAWRASQESSVANNLLQQYSFGNATDWPSNATHYGAQYGVTVSTTPQVGDIAIRTAVPGLVLSDGQGDVGHAMYVEAVNGDGTITVSEYNEYLDGTYSKEIRNIAGYYHGAYYQLQFIHFP